jgi:hypothetical protein
MSEESPNDKIVRLAKDFTNHQIAKDFTNHQIVNISHLMSAKKKGIMSWNQIAVHYSPQIYRVYKAKYQPNNSKVRDEYNLENIDYGLKIMKKGIPTKYFGNDLILVPPIIISCIYFLYVIK